MHMKMMNVNKVVPTYIQYDDIKCQSEGTKYSSLAQKSQISPTVIGLTFNEK